MELRSASDLKDLITTVVAVVTFLVAVATFKIGKNQFLVSRDNFRLSLFQKRSQILQFTLDAISETVDHGFCDGMLIRRYFRSERTTAALLFDGTVVEHLDRIFNALQGLNDDHKWMTEMRPFSDSITTDELKKVEKIGLRRDEYLTWLHSQPLELIELFRSYMDFSYWRENQQSSIWRAGASP
jgi:hypothetical protein